MSVNIKYIALIITGCVFLFSIILSGAYNSAIDFVPLYYSTQILAEGGNIYDFDQLREVIISQGHSHSAVHFLYPPFLSALILPIGQLSLETALMIWILINTVALIIAVGILIKFFLPNKLKYYLIILFGLLLFFPATNNLLLGQVNPIIYLLLVLGIIMWVQKKDTWAGIFYGLGTLIKIFPIFFIIYALFTKRYKIFYSGLLTIVGGILLTLILVGSVGLTSYLDYIKSVIPVFLTGELAYWFPGSTAPGFFDVLWTTSSFVNIVNIITKSLAIVFFVFLGIKYLIKKIKPDFDNILIELSFISILITITSSVNYHHYLLFWTIPLIIIFKFYLSDKKISTLVWLFIAFLLTAFPPSIIKSLLPYYVNDYIYPFINPGLWGMVIIIGLLGYYYFKKNK